MSGALAMGNNKITGLATPTAGTDVTNKTYVDGILGSATVAATSATNAATSATNAATSATNASNSATSAATSATNAASSYDNFDDRYLGAKSSAPTVDNDGDALITGALYFNTTSNIMFVRSSSGWQAAGSAVNGTSERTTYTATAGQTVFAATYDTGYIDVYLNGVKLLSGTDFTATNGTSITLASGASVNDVVDIVAYGTFALADHYTKTASDARYVNVAGDTMTGNLNVTGRTTTDNATVGSGTASTYVDLTVNGASTANYGPMIELQSAGTAFGKITNYGRVQGGTSTDMFVTTATTNSLMLGTNNTTRMTIDSSGNVGIGVTPSKTLDVEGSIRSKITSGTSPAEIDITSGGTWRLRSNATSGTNAYGMDIVKGSAGTDVKMSINSSGNVGIGTSSPQAELHVHDPAGHAKIRLSGAASDADTFEIYQGITGVTNGGLTIRDVEASADRLVINSSGNVGIGTNNPSKTLEVNGYGKFTSSDNSPRLHLTGGRDYMLTTTATGLFGLYDNTASSYRLAVDSSGNVGIGTSSPNNYSANHKSITLNAPTTPLIDLEVNGTRTGSFVGTSSNVDINAVANVPLRFLTNDTERMRIDSSGRLMLGTTTNGVSGAEQFTVASSGNTGITIRAGASSGSAIYMSDATSGSGEYAGYISYSHGSNAMTFASNSSERMRIDSSGKVGIGENSPSARLEIGGMAAGEQALLIQSGRNDALSNGLARINITDSNCPFVGLQVDHAGTGDAIKATGKIRATSFYGDGSNLTGVGGSTAFNAVGTYAFAVVSAGTATTAGNTRAGLNSDPATAGGHTAGTYGMSGTWRCMGFSAAFNSDGSQATLWVRIS